MPRRTVPLVHSALEPKGWWRNSAALYYHNKCACQVVSLCRGGPHLLVAGHPGGKATSNIIIIVVVRWLLDALRHDPSSNTGWCTVVSPSFLLGNDWLGCYKYQVILVSILCFYLLSALSTLFMFCRYIYIYIHLYVVRDRRLGKASNICLYGGGKH